MIQTIQQLVMHSPESMGMSGRLIRILHLGFAATVMKNGKRDLLG
jgi:hypothetical protein